MEELLRLDALPAKERVQSLDAALQRLAGTLAGPLAKGGERFARSMEKITRDLKNQIKGFDELHLLQGPEPEKPEKLPKPQKPSKPSSGSGKATISTKALTKAIREATAAVREAAAALQRIPDRILPMLYQGFAALLPLAELLEKSFAAIFTPNENALTPLFDLFSQLGGFCTQLAGSISGVFAVIWPCFGFLDQWISGFSPLIVGFYETVISPLIELFKEQFSGLWDQLTSCWHQFTDALGQLAQSLTTVWEESFVPFMGQLGEIFSPAIQWVGQVIGAVCSGVGDIVKKVTDGVVRVLDGLRIFLMSVFCKDWGHAWKGIQEIFGGVWDMIVGALKGAVNMVIDLVNLMLRAVTRAVNAVVDSINDISVTIPSWVPVFGGKTFSPHVPNMPEYQLPRLAKGAVLPANRPFLAMVGDQKRGTNVEAPLETIKDALRQVMASGAEGSFSALAPVEVKLDGEVLYRAMERIRLERGAQIGGAFGGYY